MYYLPRKEFYKIGKDIYKKMFSGFSAYNCHFKNKENKYKEHFAEPIMWSDWGSLGLEQKESAVQELTLKEESGQISKTYLMTRDERLIIIYDSLAVTLGFASYYEYKNKTKFRKDINTMMPLHKMNFDFAVTRNDALIEELKKRFNLSTEIDLPIFSFRSIPKAHFKNDLINENYSTKEEFYNALAYFYNTSELTAKKLEDLNKSKGWGQIKESLNYSTTLDQPADIYEASNNIKDVIIEGMKRFPEKDFSFLSKIQKTYHISRVIENILTLSDDDYDCLILLVKELMIPETVYLFNLVREKNKNEYLMFLFRLNKIMSQ